MSNAQEGQHESEKHVKELTIIVNGRQKVVTERELSFDQVVALGFDNPPTGNDVVFTVTYRRGEGSKPEGSMVPGDTVKVKEGMIFNVRATNQS